MPEFVAALSSAQEREREQLLRDLAIVPGIYVPREYQVEYRPDGTVAGWRHAEALPERVRRRWVEDLDATASSSFVLTEQTEFADMYLTEISRGCGRGCRFCAAGFIYRPPRERSPDNLVEQIEAGLCERSKIGLRITSYNVCYTKLLRMMTIIRVAFQWTVRKISK